MIVVRVPASSANLGPGFDALGMALTLHAELGVLAEGEEAPAGSANVPARHPAAVAFRHRQGRGRLWVRSPIPVARGLGFSGALRVAGLVAATTQHGDGGADAVATERNSLLVDATALEGHADNVAASLIGGVVAVASGRAVRVPLGVDPAVIVWVPPSTTSTATSRTTLPVDVPFGDAVFNVGRTALLVAALASGDVDALRVATADRLHQDRRFEAQTPSRSALAAGLDAGAWCGWLSGSGPAIALLCDRSAAGELAAALPSDGHTKHLQIDTDGAQVTSTAG